MSSRARKLLKGALVSTLAGAAASYVYYSSLDVDGKFALVSSSGPLVRLLDPETSHQLGILAAKLGLFPRDPRPDPPALRVELWGKSFPNPIGLAAGFDKDAEAIEGLLGLGFGFMEVGSITPKAQPGNDKPRVFRIPELKATINRYGFNSIGADAAEANLKTYSQIVSADPAIKSGLLGINLGMNKTSQDASSDYTLGLHKLGKYGDFIVINISSPNTPGLRDLQAREHMEALVGSVKAARDQMEWGAGGPPPLLVKIAPDLTEAQKQDIAAVVMKLKVDGLVVGNTTITRPDPVPQYPLSQEKGGLSGPPLMELSTLVLRDMYRLTKGQVPIIGCGGVSSGQDAWRKIKAGASLVELYTSLAYEGPALVPRIKDELVACMMEEGYTNVALAVGADHKKQPGSGGRSETIIKTKRWMLW